MGFEVCHCKGSKLDIFSHKRGLFTPQEDKGRGWKQHIRLGQVSGYVRDRHELAWTVHTSSCSPRTLVSKEPWPTVPRKCGFTSVKGNSEAGSESEPLGGSDASGLCFRGRKEGTQMLLAFSRLPRPWEFSSCGSDCQAEVQNRLGKCLHTLI